MPQEMEILLMNGVMACVGHGSRGQVGNGSKARGLWVRGIQGVVVLGVHIYAQDFATYCKRRGGGGSANLSLDL